MIGAHSGPGYNSEEHPDATQDENGTIGGTDPSTEEDWLHVQHQRAGEALAHIGRGGKGNT